MLKTIYIMRAILSIMTCCLLLQSCVNIKKYNESFERPLKVADMKKDIKYVEKKLFRMHPDINWYADPAKIRNSFDSLYASIKQPMSYMQYYFAIAPVVAQVKQGHSLIVTQKPKLEKAERERIKGSVSPYTQVKLMGEDGRFYIIEDKTVDTSLTLGAEVVAINGLQPQKVVDSFRGVITGDGNTNAYFDFLTQNNIVILYNRLLGHQDSLQLTYVVNGEQKSKSITRTLKPEKDSIQNLRDSLQLQVLSAKAMADSTFLATADSADSVQYLYDDSVKTAQIAIPNDDMPAKYKMVYGYDESTQEFAKDFKIIDSNTGVLKLRNFTMGMQRAAYKQIFDTLAALKIQNLIIDVRGNPGGKLSDIHLLHSYIATDSLYATVHPNTTTTSKYKMPLWTLRMMPAWSYPLTIPFVMVDGIIYISNTRKNDEGTYSYRIKQSKQRPTNAKKFMGDMYMITDGGTFSAATILAANFKSENRGLLVGSETGGAYNGTVAGKLPMLKRNKTRTIFRVGTMNLKPVNMNGQPGRGVEPDVIIHQTVKEKVDKIDPQMDYILEQIANKKTQVTTQVTP